MLNSLYLEQCKYAKKHFNLFLPTYRMYRISFVSPGAKTISPTNTIFNKKHSVPDRNNMYKYHGIRRMFTRIRAYTDRQTSQMYKHFSALMESVKMEIVK